MIAAASAGIVAALPAAAYASPGHLHSAYGNLSLTQFNLASDVPGTAALTDPDLKNPWGAALTPISPLWVANQGTKTATVYSLAPGSSKVAKSSTVRVTIPGTKLGPAGLVANTSDGFVLTNGTVKAPAAFIFSTLDGAIEAWSSKTNPLTGDATVEVPAVSPGPGSPAYSGLAISATPRGEELFAANFGGGGIAVFNSAFQPVTLPAGAFKDPHLPAGYLPFNVQALDGRIFVTYDQQNPTTHLEQTGPGVGVVNEFSTSGRFIARIAAGGALNAPWGLAIAPQSWGPVAGSLLIGNFGDGHINIIARDGNGYAGHVTGQILDKATGQPFVEPGLWSLVPGTVKTGGTDALWFTAGINSEQDGLLGVLRP
jgi:uncharacterized protein (TIGR03118 family)